jgi:hypothetical protein
VSPALGALAATHTLLVLLLLDRVVARRLFLARRYSPTLTVFLIVATVDAYGMLGLLIASPLAASIQVLLERLITSQPTDTQRARSLADIENRIARVRQRLVVMPPAEAAHLASVVARLDSLALQARQATASRA